MFKLRFSAYCGMSHNIVTTDERTVARCHAADALRRAREHGLKPTTLTRGEWWEICEPENCVMVPDECGQLYLRHETFECRECGSEHETADAARECCAFDECAGEDCTDPYYEDTIDECAGEDCTDPYYEDTIDE